MIEKRDIRKSLKKKKEGTRSKDGTLVYEILKKKEYSIALGELGRGERNKEHELDLEEIYYFIEGKGIMKIEGMEEKIEKGIIVKVPAGKKQKIMNVGKKALRFLMIVNPPYDPKKERIKE